MPHITIFEYFIGVIIITIGALSYLLIRGGKREERDWERSLNKERRYWRGLYVAERDEHEEEAVGEIPKLKIEQSN
jgi:hypothetical protein